MFFTQGLQRSYLVSVAWILIVILQVTASHPIGGTKDTFKYFPREGFTCSSFCDGLFKLCDSSVIDNKRTGDIMGAISEKLLCIRVRSGCSAQCRQKQGLFQSA